MKVVALAGGTGGAKLAARPAAGPPAGRPDRRSSTPGDDVERHGLLVMPDHDSVMYMLAGLFDDERGWGVVDETWATMEHARALRRGSLVPPGRPGLRHAHRPDERSSEAGGRSRRRSSPCSAPSASRARSCRWPTSPSARSSGPTTAGSSSRSTSCIATRRRRSSRSVYDGIEAARPTAQVRAALSEADVIVIGPSNPIVSIGPILAVPALSELLGRARVRGVPVVAVSAIVGGKALKGPADRMLTSLGHEASARRGRRDPGAVHRWLRARSRRRGPRARDRRARAADPRHRHDHGRRRGPATPGRGRADVRGPAAGRGRVGTIGGVTTQDPPSGSRASRRSSRSGRSRAPRPGLPARSTPRSATTS